MNENLNLVEILKDCPKGTKLYSPIAGEVYLRGIEFDHDYPICVKKIYEYRVFCFMKDGKYHKDGECMLLPSKDQRDWSKFKPKKPKFDPKTLQPFDKVLLNNENHKWNCGLVSHIESQRIYLTTGGYVYYCIPYNDDTKHLVGTTDEAPEFYRYWED